MPAPKPTAPRRLTRLRVNEISLCASPANVHAKALIAKTADAATDLDRRLTAMERERNMADAPQRLMKAAREAGDRLQAQAEGRQHLPPLPAATVAKNADGGARLVARAIEVAKAHRDVQQDHRPAAAETPATKSAASPAVGLIAAAQRRAAMMKAG